MYGLTILDYIILVSLVLLAVALWVKVLDVRWAASSEPEPPRRTSEWYDWVDRNTNPYAGISAGIAAVAAGLLIVAALPALFMQLDKKECRDAAHAMGRDYLWDSYTGCLYQTDDGEFVKEDMLRFDEHDEPAES